MKEFIIGTALALAMVSTSNAQSTRQNLSTFNNQEIIPNGNGAITGAIVNNMNNQFINGFGVLGDTNAWSGSNTFSGPVAFPGIPNVQHGDAIPAAGQEYINSSGFHAIAQ